MSNVIVAVANSAYLPHVYSLFGNLRSIGQYKDDLALVFNGELSEEDYKFLTDRKVYILFDEVKHPNPFFSKFNVFHTFFKQWDKILYLDCDMIVRGDVNSTFDQEGYLFADIEEFKICQYLKNVDENVFNELKSWFSHLNDYGYNTSALLINSKIIAEDSVEKLYFLAEKYKAINKHIDSNGTDQGIFSLIYQDIYQQIKGISFVNRPSDSKILHCTRYLFPYNSDYYNKGIENFKGLKN